MSGWAFDFKALAVDLPPLNADELCGATTRTGRPCRGIPVRLKDRELLVGGIPLRVPSYGRCRMHGGASTGPKTPQGKAAIAANNRRRASNAPSSTRRMGSGRPVGVGRG
jgi:hypothetical protein